MTLEFTVKPQRPQTNRHLKLECDKCGCIVRTTKKTLDRIDGNPICIDPVCDGTLEPS